MPMAPGWPSRSSPPRCRTATRSKLLIQARRRGPACVRRPWMGPSPQRAARSGRTGTACATMWSSVTPLRRASSCSRAVGSWNAASAGSCIGVGCCGTGLAVWTSRPHASRSRPACPASRLCSTLCQSKTLQGNLTQTGSQTILDRKADYVLALKGNQGPLRADVELFVAEQKSNGFKHATSSRDETVDGDHGRIETRTTTVLHDVSWLQERHDWPGLNGVVIVDSIREIGRTIERETRLFIPSLSLPAKSLAGIVRSHWAVENSLHWVMDMVFRDDECRIRTDHAPANFTTIKHMALNLTRRAPGKDSLRLRRKVAAWDDDYLASLIAA